jgi:hypothetical protein
MSNIETRFMKVTPAMAEAWMLYNKKNRKLKPFVVQKYADDMRKGYWEKSHQGIAFFEDGSLADGQHRLNAIIESGCEIEMLVTFNIPKSSILSIDRHSIRTTHDNIKLSQNADWMTKKHIEIVNVILRLSQFNKGIYISTTSPAETMEVAEKFKELLLFVTGLNNYSKSYVSTASILACYGLAFLDNEDKMKLKRFSDIMISGEKNDSESNAPIKLREYCIFGRKEMDLENESNKKSADSWLITIKKIQYAVKWFCEDKNIKSLISTDFHYTVPNL